MNKKQSFQKNNALFNKLQPQNVEAEESILSAVLLDNNSLIDAIEILTPKDFYKSAHQKIFLAVLKLFEDSEPIDLVTVSNKLKEMGILEEIGGASYLAKLVDTVPLAVNARHYSKIIKDKSSLRFLIQKSAEIAEKCYNDSGNVDEVINFSENVIFEISENKIKQSFHKINQLIDDNIDTLEERQGNPNKFTGIPYGFPHMDAMTSGLQNSDLIIIAARPSMGKTALAMNIARNVAIESKIPVAIFSLEMSSDQLSMRLLTSEARVDSTRVKKGYLDKDTWEHLTFAAGILSEAPIYIDDSADISAMEIRAKARRLKMEKNLGLIIVDYLQLMKSFSSKDRRDLEIAEISRSLKILAKELNIPVIALSQLNRMLEQRNNKRPMLSDLRESGALEQDADLVAFIYRDEVYNKEEDNPNKGKTEIIIAKHRNGKVGKVYLHFQESYTRFETLDMSEYLE